MPRHIKLYNAGNFFDAQAIPPEDYRPIIERIRDFDTVIVENHPRLCGVVVPDFARALGTQLEVASAWKPSIPRFCRGSTSG